MTKIKTENLLALGILGGILATISDFLIIYTDLSTAVKLPLVYLGTDIAKWRATLSLIFAVLSYVMYISAYKGVSVQLKRTNESLGIWFYRIILANSLVWLFIHFSQCLSIYLYNSLNKYNSPNSLDIITDIMGNYSILVMILFATNTIPLLLLLYNTIKGNTVYPKMYFLANPLIISVIAILPYMIFKNSGLAYTVYLSGGNIGMFIFFAFNYLMERNKFAVK